jgi:hypothetical protein
MIGARNAAPIAFADDDKITQKIIAMVATLYFEKV